MNMSLARSGLTAFAWEFTSNLAVIGRRPALAVEVIVVTGCITLLLGLTAGAVFVAGLCLLAGGRPDSERVEGLGRRRPFMIRFNLLHQKACLALVLLWPAPALREQTFWAASLLGDFIIPFMMAGLVRSWWSPEMDTRWDVTRPTRTIGRDPKEGMS